MLQLLHGAALVMTDSGGLQKEAFFFRKYCITLREETEWVELIENGYNHLAGHNPDLIISLTKKFVNNHIEAPVNLYGNGTAALKICQSLLNEFSTLTD